MANRHFREKSAEEAWNRVNEIFPTDYAKDEDSSQRAGYPIFRSTADGHFYDYICDLNDRLEVNLSTGETVNIWIEQETEPEVTPDTLVMMVDCSENNVRCMKNCLKSCQRVHKYIQKNPEEIEEWQIAGINAMFDQANKEGIVPYDLPYAIEGILLILDPEVNK